MYTDIDELIFTATFSLDAAVAKNAQQRILTLAQKQGIYPASLYELYRGFGLRKIHGFTIPAINLRTLTYHLACIVFRIMREQSVGPVIFELAHSESIYTDQSPRLYAATIFAAALKENYTGPVFLQADHVQLHKKEYEANANQEIVTTKQVVQSYLQADFYNIDIDASVLVEYITPDLTQQQIENCKVTALLTSFIRQQPCHTAITIGGEIGHIGGKNSTVSEFEAFMQLYLSLITVPGISKVSIQTGTQHGGTLNKDGVLQEPSIDISVIKDIGDVARDRYRLGGAVQHGASTIPLSRFHEFTTAETLEIHLATQFQNIVLDNLPDPLQYEIAQWTQTHCSSNRDPSWTDAQFIYRMRKKALGPFKKVLWQLSKDEKHNIETQVSGYIQTLFQSLNLINTTTVLKEYGYLK